MTYSTKKNRLQVAWSSNLTFKMLKVKNSAKAHTTAIPDQEIDVPISHEESTSSDHESESEISFHPSR